MFSRSKWKTSKIIAIFIVIAIVLGMLVKNIYSTTDSHYVIDVIKESATTGNKDSNMQVTETIVKGEGEEVFNSKKLDYEVELKNIAQDETIETQIAMVVDSSYSVNTNDVNNRVRTTAKELASGILDNVAKSRVSISNNSSQKISMTTNKSSIESAIDNLQIGEGPDSNQGLDNAINSFSDPLKSGEKVNKYIIVFTDATDDVKQKIKEIDSSINIISILVDMTSTSYIEDNTPIRDDVYLLLSEVSESDLINDVEILDVQKIYGLMNKTVSDITLENTFSDEILDNFDISGFTGDGEIEKTENGYKWTVNQLKYQQTAKLTFTIELKTNKDINAGLIFEDIYTNKVQNIKYTTYKDEEKTLGGLQGTDSNEGTESTVIRICQGYDVKIQAVNESNLELGVSGIEVTVSAFKDDVEISRITKTTDSNGYITITPEDARALRAEGEITFIVSPYVENKVGYTSTNSKRFVINSNKQTKILNKDEDKSEIIPQIDEEKRLVEVKLPINSQRIDFELRLEELNNSNITLSGAEFELIQPKLNNKYEMDVLSGVTDEYGVIHFAPTVMTKDGSYNYILRQVSAPDGYEITNLTLITITFKDGKIVTDPGIQFNPNVKGNKENDEHVIIIVENENLQQDPFNLQINLQDNLDGTKLNGVTYLIKTTNSNNVTRSEYVTTDANGQINAKIYGSGNLILDITEQSPKTGYVAQTRETNLIIQRINDEIKVIQANTSDGCNDVGTTTNKDGIIVNLYSQKKVEQNIVKVSLVEAEENDVPVGAGISYKLIDLQTQEVYGPVSSNRKGELSFTLGSKTEGEYSYLLELDSYTLPDEYDNSANKNDIRVNLVYDSDGYIKEVNTANGDEIVIDRHASIVSNDTTLEYTAFITIGYEMNISNTIDFKIQLLDYDDLSKALEGATYNIDIEWDAIVSGETVTRTKTITGRKTNARGEITTRIQRIDGIRINVTQVGAKVGYAVDLATQEIELTFNNNGTIRIDQTPYDFGVTNKDEPNKGTKVNNRGEIVYQHLNKQRSAENTYLNLTIVKKDTAGLYVDGIPLKIKSETLVDKNEEKIDLLESTGSQGSIGTYTIDYNQYVSDRINNNTIRVPGIGEKEEEIYYDLEVSEWDVTKEKEKAGTTVKLRLIFRYKDNRVTLTNAETIYGNRLVISKIFSSGSDTVQGTEDEDEMGIFLSNITLELYTNYDDVGNLSIDFKKENSNEQELQGAEYSLKATNPDGTVVRKNNIKVKNGQDSADIEISGLNVNVGTIIELTETKAPVGYGINENTETLEVVYIDDSGEITLEQKDVSYIPNRLKMEKLVSTETSAGTVKTNYEVTLIDYQLDVFEFEITAKDSNTKEGIEGYGFKINSSKGATSSILTDIEGKGTTKVGGNIADDVITYTITATAIADYYKPLSSIINVNLVFDEFGYIDTQATLSAQTDSSYGILWNINTIGDSEFGPIGINIFVEHQDPLVVKVDTIDKITNVKLNGVSYKVTESIDIPGTGSDTIEVGYVRERGVQTYIISQTDIQNSYQQLFNRTFTIEYENEIVKNANMNDTTVDTIEITGDKEVTITLYVEPKVPFEITNIYYFNNSTPLQGANFEVISQRNQDIMSKATDANGKTGIYSDIFGTNESVIYKVRQTKGAYGYATVEDFYIKVTYNENREITDAILADEYGNQVTDNRFVTIGFIKSSTYSNYNSNNKGIVTIEVLNYPEFKMMIEDVDRRDGITPISGTEYSVKSSYVNNNNEEIDFTSTSGVLTDASGIGTAHLDKTKDNTVVTYIITETAPATGYQSLGTDIKVIVSFDDDGFIKNIQVDDDNNLSKIEHASKIEPVVNPEDNFVINLQLKNNPLLKINMTTKDISTKELITEAIGIEIVGTENEQVYSKSSATNRANKTEEAETVFTSNGMATAYMDRTLDNKNMEYTIAEVQKSPGYDWAEENVVIRVSYDSDGKISSGSAIAIIQAATNAKIISYDEYNFEINIELYYEEIKEFGIHLTAIDTYDKNKRLNDMKVEAFLCEPGNESYISDGKYELIGENSLLTGADRDEDGKPDITYGEDYLSIGTFEESTGENVTRTLRLVIKNDSIESGSGSGHHTGYYVDSTDGSNEGNNVGYYRGNSYFKDAKYQTVEYQYLISVTFDDEGKIVSAKLNTGLNNNIGWLTDDRYIEVDENGYLSHTDYKLNVTMKFFPMLDLKLNAMDNYTYQTEINETGLPIALEGTTFRITTTRHYTATPTQYDEYNQSGYIGYGESYGWSNERVEGHIYEDTDEIFLPAEPNKQRIFYVFEESEPTNYQQYSDRYIVYYEQRLVAIIKVQFNEYGEVDFDNSIVRKTETKVIEPYIAENQTSYLPPEDVNTKQYNYYCTHNNEQKVLDFYIGYALTTKINITGIDDISGNPIDNIRLTPFITNHDDDVNTRQSYEWDPIGYRDTNSEGKVAVKYWGAAIQNNVSTYVIGSARQGDNYNGYLFPSDMASGTLGETGISEDYFTKLDVTYDKNGKISNVKSVGSDLWGDDNVADITWDSKTGNININMLYSRKFQVSLNKVDYYDSTVNKLIASFDVISNKGLKTSINSKRTNDVSTELTTLGKVYKDTSVTYTLSETKVPDGYYPIQDNVVFNVEFDKEGNIGKNSIKSKNDYFEVESTSDTTRKVNKTAPDLTINIKNKPAFNLNIRIIDKFYKNDGIEDVYLKVTHQINGETLSAVGNPQTDANGYANVVTGPVYPGKTVVYSIKQTNIADGYYENATEVKLEVKFNDAGKIEDYRIIDGNNVINNFNSIAYKNSRQIDMQIMNMPKDLKIGLSKRDKTTNEPMPGVQFTITKEDINSGIVGTPVTITTNANGDVVENLDTFDTSLSGKQIKYTIHEDETPESYRTMEDVVFIVRYNADGSIASFNQISNENNILNTDTVPQVAIGTIKYLNDERVHFAVYPYNDNAFDIIIKNEDTNYEGLGIEGSTFGVSVNGKVYSSIEKTNADGITKVKDITESGSISIKIAQNEVGDGYKFDIDNTVEIKLEKGEQIYSLDLNANTDGYVDDKHATTTKAEVTVDEIYGTITVTFKNETKTEITLIKQDINTYEKLKDTKFEVTAQQIDNNGETIGDPVVLTTVDNNTTDVNGEIYFDLGVAPQSEIWKYTFKEITPPAGYNPIVDLVMTVTYDQYGKILSQETNKETRLKPAIEHNNDNCRNMYAIIYNGDVSPAYKVKVVTEDSDTGKRINGSTIKMTITDENGDLITVEPITSASARNSAASITSNLGIDGKMYTDKEVDDKDGPTPVIIERGLTYIDNVDYEGTINIEVSQTETADGYVFGGQKTDGNIKINATYVPHLDDDPTVEFDVIDNDGMNITFDNTNKLITIKILNKSQVMFNITTEQFNPNSEDETVYINGVNYTITSEVQTAVDSIQTDLNVTTPLSNNGKTKQDVGSAYAGKTVLYTLHQNTPDGYQEIEDIQIEIQYDSRGYIKYCELLSAESNCYIDEENTTGRIIELVVMNRKTFAGYIVNLEKHSMDTDENEDAYGITLPGATYKITVQQTNGIQNTYWTGVTDENGLMKGIRLNGTGYITVMAEELEAPEGYREDVTRIVRLYRNSDTGEMTKVDSNININDDLEEDEEGNTIIKLLPIDEQRKDKFTLVINKLSSATDKYITNNQAEFKAELIQKDEEGNVTYKETLTDAKWTDKNGKATIDNLAMPQKEGNYTLIISEIEAPEGYVKLEKSIEIPVSFIKDDSDNVVIKNANLSGLDDVVKLNALKDQFIAFNIYNDVAEEILEDEYSLDITKVDAETGESISNMAIFKVLLPDEKETSVYAETMENLLGEGKLDYCYIEQDKDYQVRLTHMKLPESDTILTYVFKEIVAPDGYAKIDEDIELNIEFATDEDTGEMYIKDVVSSNPEYLRINTITPCSTDTRLEIDILNRTEEQTKWTVKYEANDGVNGADTQNVPEEQTKEGNVDLNLSLQEPTRDGYIFKGWSMLPNGQVQFNPGDIYTLDQDITLYAVWGERLYLKSTEYIISDEINYKEDSKLDENIYEEGDKYIIGLYPKLTIENEQNANEWTMGTNIKTLISKVNTNAETVKIYDVNNEEITDSVKYIGTNMTIEFIKGEEKIRLIAIVKGDINGDGLLNLSDIQKGRQYIRTDDEKYIDTIEKKIAIDTNVDGLINMRDINNMARAQNTDDVRELDR